MPLQTAQQPDREQVAIANCGLLLERLTAVVAEENTLLVQPKAAFHGQLTGRKTQLLRDLAIAERACRSRAAAQLLKPKASALRAVLARNQQLLAAHIKAVNEISGIIVDALRQQDSDGTYSRYGQD